MDMARTVERDVAFAHLDGRRFRRRRGALFALARDRSRATGVARKFDRGKTAAGFELQEPQRRAVHTPARRTDAARRQPRDATPWASCRDDSTTRLAAAWSGFDLLFDCAEKFIAPPSGGTAWLQSVSAVMRRYEQSASRLEDHINRFQLVSGIGARPRAVQPGFASHPASRRVGRYGTNRGRAGSEDHH